MSDFKEKVIAIYKDSSPEVWADESFPLHFAYAIQDLIMQEEQ